MDDYRETAVPPDNYISTGPWQVTAFQIDTDRALQLTTHDTLDEALRVLDRFHLPPYPNRGAGIVDANRQVIVCYCPVDDGTIEWFGTNEGWAAMADTYLDNVLT